MVLLELIRSDFVALYKGKNSYLKALLNPSFHAAALIRLAQCSGIGFWFWRNLLLMKHGIDVGRGFRVGPGLVLPHPTGIVIGGGVVAGADLLLYQSVTLGKHHEGYPVIGKGVVIYPNSVVVGPVSIGDGAIIGALQFVSYSVESGQVVKHEH